MKALRDTGTVFGREMQPTLKDPFAILIGMAQPLVFLALFGPLLSEMPGIEGGSPWQWFVAGNLVMLALFGTSMVGYSMLMEMHSGAHERLLVTPLNRAAMLVGRTMKDIVVLLTQGAIIILAVAPFGFHIYPLGTLAGLLLLAVFGIGLGALSHGLAIILKDREYAFWGVMQTALYPLLLLSGVLLPMEMAPSWLETASRVNPITHIVEAERARFAGDFAQQSVLLGAVAALAVAAIGLAVGTRAMRHAA
ncbi:MAG: ABC transporter permease [Thermomicrobiales bacterium]